MGEVLAVDIGGSHVKIRIPSQPEKRRFVSGPDLTPEQMVAGVKDLVKDWNCDQVSIGIPAPIENNTALVDPVNLGKGWVGFDFDDAFGLPSKIINDAAMQAVGSYDGGSMLFLGLGTGLGTCLIDRYMIHPTEIAHMPFKKDKTYEECVGEAALESEGKKDWKATVLEVAEVLYKGLLPDYIVLGGGNVKKFKDDDALPDYCRRGDNADAFLGGFRMWERQWAKGLP